MPSLKIVIIPIVTAILGSAAGAALTYFHYTKVRVNDFVASDRYMAASILMEQIALVDQNEMALAKSKLNYHLAAYIIDARFHAGDNGGVGWVSRKLLQESARHRSEMVYKVEEEKVLKAIAEPKVFM